jgi:magnesium-transporting ATPase (P-type)
MASTHAPGDEHFTERGPTGWAVFAGSILLILGFLNFFWGLAAVLEDENLVVGGQGVIIVDVTAWGWASMIVGVIQIATGFGLFAAREWARWAGILFASLAAIGQIGIVTAFPVWSLIIVLLAVAVIYHLAVRWESA